MVKETLNWANILQKHAYGQSTGPKPGPKLVLIGSFLALLDYVSRAYGIAIAMSVVCPNYL